MIDWDRVQELKDEVGEEDFAEVLELFFTELDETLNGLGDLSGTPLAEALHFVKGSALNIGLSELGRLCLDAETMLAKADATQIDIATIREAFAASRVALAA